MIILEPSLLYRCAFSALPRALDVMCRRRTLAESPRALDVADLLELSMIGLEISLLYASNSLDVVWMCALIDRLEPLASCADGSRARHAAARRHGSWGAADGRLPPTKGADRRGAGSTVRADIDGTAWTAGRTRHRRSGRDLPRGGIARRPSKQIDGRRRSGTPSSRRTAYRRAELDGAPPRGHARHGRGSSGADEIDGDPARYRA